VQQRISHFPSPKIAQQQVTMVSSRKYQLVAALPVISVAAWDKFLVGWFLQRWFSFDIHVRSPQ